MMIVKGFDDGIEPVEGDGTQVKGADSTGMNINRVPQITDRWTKNPPSKDLLGSIKGHGETSHNEVSKSEANQEIVVDPTESSVQDDTENYKEVGEYGDHND